MRDARGTGGLVAGGVTAILLGLGTAARADIYTYQGHTLKYAAPPGYCLMDRQGVIGSATYALLEKAMGEDVEFVAIYLNCDELTTLLETRTTPLLHGGAIAIPKSGGSVVVRDDETRRDEIDRQIARINTVDIGWVNDQLKLKAEERGVVFHELQDIRLVDHDDTAAYAALIDANDNLHQPMLSLVALSLTNQLPFKTLMIAPASDPNVIQNLLAAQRRYVTWLIAQNETDEERRKQAQPTPSMLGGIGNFAGEGSIVVGLLCFLGAVWLLFRLRRA